MEEDPYESFASQHGEVAGRTRGIRSGSAAQRKRQAYIRHGVAEGGSGAGGGGSPGWPGEASRTWEPNPDSSVDEVEVIVYPEPRRSLTKTTNFRYFHFRHLTSL